MKDTIGVATETIGVTKDTSGIATHTIGIAKDTIGIATETIGVATDTFRTSKGSIGVTTQTFGVVTLSITEQNDPETALDIQYTYFVDSLMKNFRNLVKPSSKKD